MEWLLPRLLRQQREYLMQASLARKTERMRQAVLDFNGAVGWNGPFVLIEAAGDPFLALIRGSKLDYPRAGRQRVSLWGGSAARPALMLRLENGKAIVAERASRARAQGELGRMRRLLRLVAWLVGLGVMALAAYHSEQAWQAHQVLQLARQSEGWPGVDGVIERAEAKSAWRSQGRGGTRQFHWLELSYRYRVGGRDYQGARIYFGPGETRDGDQVQRELARYPEGAAVRVHYQPDAPDIAVLEPGRTDRALRQRDNMLGLSLSLLALGVFSLLLFLGLSWYVRRLFQRLLERLDKLA
jgi:hypothetical protein